MGRFTSSGGRISMVFATYHLASNLVKRGVITILYLATTVEFCYRVMIIIMNRELLHNESLIKIDKCIMPCPSCDGGTMTLHAQLGGLGNSRQAYVVVSGANRLIPLSSKVQAYGYLCGHCEMWLPCQSITKQ